MGTRADFYTDTTPEAEWLGSIAWDGYPHGVFNIRLETTDDPAKFLPLEYPDPLAWDVAVRLWIAGRDDGTQAAQGWPWPWDDSNTTDYAYALHDGRVVGWFDMYWFFVDLGEPDEDEEGDRDNLGVAEFPDMSDRKAVTYGSRSGVMMIGADGPIPPSVIDAEEAAR